jgi:hypothetical protein
LVDYQFSVAIAMKLLSIVLAIIILSPQEARVPGIGGQIPAGATHSIAVSCMSSNSATMNCQLSAVPASTPILIQLEGGTTSVTVTAARICAGTSSCSSSTDVLTNDVPLTASDGTGFQAWSDLSPSVSGSVMVTFTAFNCGTFCYLFAEAVPGVSSFDTSGVAFNTAGANGTITTAGNIRGANDVVISEIASSTAPTAGTTNLCATSGCTALQVTGGVSAEYAVASPTFGNPATISWTNASGNWRSLVVAYK